MYRRLTTSVRVTWDEIVEHLDSNFRAKLEHSLELSDLLNAVVFHDETGFTLTSFGSESEVLL